MTFIEALDQLMPGFDPEIGKLAQRVLINPRKIDSHTGVFASKVLKNQIYTTHTIAKDEHSCIFLKFFINVMPCADHSSEGWKTSTDRAH